MKGFLITTVVICMCVPSVVSHFQQNQNKTAVASPAKLDTGPVKCDPGAQAGDRSKALARNQCQVDELEVRRSTSPDPDLYDELIAVTKATAERYYNGSASQAEANEILYSRNAQINSELQTRAAIRHSTALGRANYLLQQRAALRASAGVSCFTSGTSTFCQ